MEALLGRVATGDRAAFRALYTATAGRIYAVCHRILRDHHHTEDVVQKAYVRIWQKAGSYDGAKGSALAWMIVLARRLALNDLRDRGQAMGDLSGIEDSALLAVEPLVEAGHAPRLQQCLAALDDNQRRCVLLAYLHGLTHEELAVAMDKPLGTVKSWVRRGLANLKECLS
jgi:RNA polymerase sigma-70 factor (ECF subfamily)